MGNCQADIMSPITMTKAMAPIVVQDKVSPQVIHKEEEEKEEEIEQNNQYALNTTSPSKTTSFQNDDCPSNIKSTYAPTIQNHLIIRRIQTLNIKVEPDEQLDHEGMIHQPYLLDDGYIYVGQWKNQVKHGMGELYWPNGSLYHGYFANDQQNGSGVFYSAEGEVYVQSQSYEQFGQWFNGFFHGQGKFYYQDGSIYEGQWCKNQINTSIRIELKDSNIHQHFANGMRQGKGKFIWADGSQYEGDFCNNDIEGQGIYIWTDGRSYEGDWIDGKMNGHGKFNWPEGKKYTGIIFNQERGQFMNDHRDGYGIFEWGDGRIYQGFWKNGKQHGDGRLLKKDGTEIKGQWQEGILK